MNALADIINILRSHRFDVSTEKNLQDGIAEVLTKAGIAFEREVTLADGDIIDFKADKLGIEIKTKHSLAQVTRQVFRYVQSPLIDSLLLVTTRSRHGGLPEIIDGKSVTVLYLIGNAL